MTPMEIVVMATATVLGPVLAVQAQKWIERATERKNRRQWVFRALMANRGAQLNDDYVRALNLIDLDFASEKSVINAWRSLLGTLNENLGADPTEAVVIAWNRTVTERTVSLLSEMSKSLGYDFPDEQLRRGIYYPKGRAELEQSALQVVHRLRDVLIAGNGTIPISMAAAPGAAELAEAQVELLHRSARCYGDDGAMRVRVVGDDPLR